MVGLFFAALTRPKWNRRRGSKFRVLELILGKGKSSSLYFRKSLGGFRNLQRFCRPTEISSVFAGPPKSPPFVTGPPKSPPFVAGLPKSPPFVAGPPKSQAPDRQKIKTYPVTCRQNMIHDELLRWEMRVFQLTSSEIRNLWRIHPQTTFNIKYSRIATSICTSKICNKS